MNRDSRDPRDLEREAIQAGLPPINEMGRQAAEDSGLNDVVRAQLRYADELLGHYIARDPRGWGDDAQMPHEWGSLDSYDDMRTALHVAGDLLDHLLDEPADTAQANVIEVIKGRNLGGIAGEVLDFVGFDEANEASWEMLGLGMHSTPQPKGAMDDHDKQLEREFMLDWHAAICPSVLEFLERAHDREALALVLEHFLATTVTPPYSQVQLDRFAEKVTAAMDARDV